MRGAIHLMQYADFYLTYYLLSAMITVSVTALAFSPDSTVKSHGIRHRATPVPLPDTLTDDSVLVDDFGADRRPATCSSLNCLGRTSTPRTQHQGCLSRPQKGDSTPVAARLPRRVLVETLTDTT